VLRNWALKEENAVLKQENETLRTKGLEENKK
jgi:hypothetical protein